MTRIGILSHVFVDWGGGLDLLRGVMASLRQARPDLELHVLVPDSRLRPPLVRLYRRVMQKDIKRNAPPSANHLDELVSSIGGAVIIHRVAPDRHALARLARALSLDVLLPAHNPLPADYPFPWVGYIADFQHRYLPHLFSEQERRSRDAHFMAMLTRARTVIVSSQAAAADAARFHPRHKARIFSLPFNAAPQSGWLESATDVASRYGIPGSYFLISNQFWKHKDHATAFAAFVAVSARHPDVHLVCTGSTSDYRDPQHFHFLQQFLRDQGVAERVHILGMVPKLDQVELMKFSLALLQPTLFEGTPGGLAVFDAVSLGVRCVVSDIEVNRELNDPLVTFFAAGDPTGLASQMFEILNQTPRPTWDIKSLHDSGVARRAKCGHVLLESIRHACSD